MRNIVTVFGVFMVVLGLADTVPFYSLVGGLIIGWNMCKADLFK